VHIFKTFLWTILKIYIYFLGFFTRGLLPGIPHSVNTPNRTELELYLINQQPKYFIFNHKPRLTSGETT